MQPPQNPYSGFPNPNEPVQPYSQNTQPARPEISFDSISQAWTVFQSAAGVYIGSTLLALIVIGFMQVFLMASMRPGAPTAPGQPPAPPEFSPAAFIMIFVASFIYSILLAGIMRMAINHLKTGQADFSQVFSAFNVLPNLILASILAYIAVVLGTCLCIVPGLLLSGLFMFVWPLILDRRMGAIEAINTSFNTLKPHMWMALLYVIVLSLLSSAGSLACGVGVLVTMPLTIISLAITYRNFFPDGGTGFNFQGPNTPNAPIADPRY